MEHRAGFVNILGNPNVGKSTLMNHVQIPNHTSPDQGNRERGGFSDRIFRYPGGRETQLQDAGIYA